MQIWPNFAWLCPKKTFFKICPNFLSFRRSKKGGAKSGQGGFCGPMANEAACAIPKGNRWNVAAVLGLETTGAALAPTMRLTKSAAKCAGAWDCFCEGCAIAQLTTGTHVSNTRSHTNLFGGILGTRGKERRRASAEKGPKAATEQISSSHVPRIENRNEGTFAKTTLRSTDRKPEWGYIRQNHPFTKPPFLWSAFPCFLEFLASFTRNSLIFECFPSFRRIFGVRPGRKILAFSVVFLAFTEKARKGRSGFLSQWNAQWNFHCPEGTSVSFNLGSMCGGPDALLTFFLLPFFWREPKQTHWTNKDFLSVPNWNQQCAN